MKVSYQDQGGRPLDPSRLKAGTPLIAVVEISRPSLSKDYENLALSQIFPSGWEISNARVMGVGTTNNQLDYQDIRDDRVLSYYNGFRYAKQTIKVELTATYPGKWYLPPTWLEAMYEGSVSANSKGRWVEVVVE